MKKGFTIMELIVVTGIIILLAALILPNYRAGQRAFALQRAVSKLAQDIRRAQEMTMASKEFLENMPPEGGYGIYFNMSEPYHYILFADTNANQEYDGSSELVEDIEIESGITINDLPASKTVILFQPPIPRVIFRLDGQSYSGSVVSITLGDPGETYYSLIDSLSGHFSPRASCDTSSFSQDCPPNFLAGSEDPLYVYDWFQESSSLYEYQYQEDVSGHPSPRAGCDIKDANLDCPDRFSAQGSDPEEAYDWYVKYNIEYFVREERIPGYLDPRAFCDFNESIEDCTQGVCDCSQLPEECFYSFPSGGEEPSNVYYDWCNDAGQPYSRKYVGVGDQSEYSRRFLKTPVGGGRELSNRYQKLSSGQTLKVEAYNTGVIKITK